MPPTNPQPAANDSAEVPLLKFLDRYFSMGSVFYGLSCIAVVRTTFELLLEADHNLKTNADFYETIAFYAHAYLFWLCLFFAMALLIAGVLQVTLEKSLRLVLLFAPITASVPFTDYLVSRGSNMYYGQSLSDFGHNFLYLFIPWATVTLATTGIRVEIFLVTVGTFVIARFCFKKSLLRSFCLTLGVYLTIFLFGYMPAFMPHVPTFSTNELDILIFLVVSVLLGLLGLGQCRLDSAWRPFLRYLLFPSRLGFYVILLVAGMLLASRRDGLLPSPFSYAGSGKLVLAVMSVVLLFIYAKLQNDKYDREIDAVSNAQRQAVSTAITPEAMTTVRIGCLVLSIIFIIGTGPYGILLWGLLFSLSALYSEPPLRLRRFYPFGHYVLSLVGTVVFIMGGSINSAGQFFKFSGVPTVTVLVFTSFFALSHIKDFKDIDGDRQGGVANIYNMVRYPRVIGMIAVLIFAAAIFALSGFLPANQIASLAGVGVYLIISLGIIGTVRDIRRLDGILYLSLLLLLYLSVVWLSQNPGSSN